MSDQDRDKTNQPTDVSQTSTDNGYPNDSEHPIEVSVGDLVDNIEWFQDESPSQQNDVRDPGVPKAMSQNLSDDTDILWGDSPDEWQTEKASEPDQNGDDHWGADLISGITNTAEASLGSEVDKPFPPIDISDAIADTFAARPEPSDAISSHSSPERHSIDVAQPRHPQSPAFRSPSMIPPAKNIQTDLPALETQDAFRREVQRLARIRDFRAMAALHESALSTCEWATVDDVQARLLVDLAKIYKERLTDQQHAQRTFERLVQRRPGHGDAIRFLSDVYTAAGETDKLHRLYTSAIEAEWSPERRLELTKITAAIALDQMNDPMLAASDWQRLLDLGDTDPQISTELSKVYRGAQRWAELGEFLASRAMSGTPISKIPLLREAIESFVASGDHPERAKEIIEQLLADHPDDPISLGSLAILYAQQRNWQELEKIASRTMDEVKPSARLDVIRLTAQLLVQAGQLDAAASAYNCILAITPNDREALDAREQYLRDKGDEEGLLQFLTVRAEKSRTTSDKASYYERAAAVAFEKLHADETAAHLYEQAVQAKPNNPSAYEALVTLYDRLQNVEGITRALQSLAKIMVDSRSRAQVLGRLGEHYAYRANNDDEAHRCWTEVAAVFPSDLHVQKELNAIHQRKGDFAKLDLALTRQLWRTTDLSIATQISREAAHNLQENLTDEGRTIAAWLHVLDLDPNADDALEALSQSLANKSTTQVQGIWEAQLSKAIAAGDDARRDEIGLRIAEAWQKRKDNLAAIAAYERVRSWKPQDDRALDPLVKLYAKNQQDGAMSVVEIAASQTSDPEQAHEFLKRGIGLIAPNQKLAQFFLQHRLMRLDPAADATPVIEAAEKAEAWKDLACLFERLCEGKQGSETFHEFRHHLAQLCEKQLKNPQRAFAALQSLALSASGEQERLELTRLAEKTDRWEDLLAILDACIETSTSRSERQALLRQRADICEIQLEDGHRAMLELQRVVQGQSDGILDEIERRSLQQMHTLAVEHNLVAQLEAVYSELWDTAPDDETRTAVARARQAIRRDHMNDPVGALQQLLLIARMRPNDEAVTNEILEASEELNQWTITLPVLEGLWRAKGDDPAALRRVAKLYRDKCDAAPRAVELLCEALRLDPTDDKTLQTLLELGDETGNWERIVIAVRQAASSSAQQPLGLQLAKQLASLYENKLKDPVRSLSTHRWILQVWPDQQDSLEALIQAHRDAREFDDLRYRLEQWIDQVQDASRHAERWFEIGSICQNELNDPAGALVAYSSVLELEPTHEQATQALEELGDVALPLALRKKKVQVELRRATGERRVALLQSLADINQQMAQPHQAIEALQQLFEIPEGRELAVPSLIELLTQTEQWQQLADLEETLADSTDTNEQLNRLQRALQVAQTHLSDAPRVERLLRRIVDLQPHASEAITQLTRLLRDEARFQDLGLVLTTQLQNHPQSYQPTELARMHRELVRLIYHVENDLERTAQLLRDAPKTNAAVDTATDATTDADPHAGHDALWLATIAAAASDHQRYIEQRKNHLAQLPKRLGALVLCHLAEHCDENISGKGRVLGLYREARSLDPSNAVATEALRGLGRGVKTWREGSSLLPDTDELSLTNQQRAARLFDRAQALVNSDQAQGIEWLERTVAVDPNHLQAWDALRGIALKNRDYSYAYTMTIEALGAYERTVSPTTHQDVTAFAQRLADAASLAILAEQPEQSQALAAAAYGMDPKVVTAALLVADGRFSRGEMQQAMELYERIVRGYGSDLPAHQHAQALHRIAQVQLDQGNREQAQQALKLAIELMPLHASALTLLAQLHKSGGRPVSSALAELTSLMVQSETHVRGQICHRIGVLCDTELTHPEEAGAWFELAVEAGVQDKATMRRLLQHYRKTGRAQQALVAIGDLIESTTEAMELADLWSMRGSILIDYDLVEAETALDTALSFNPAHPEALASLCDVLEGRQDFEQLTAMLEARSDSGTLEQRTYVLRKLANLSVEQLKDLARGEKYLSKLVKLAPNEQDLTQLLWLVRQNPARSNEELNVIVQLMEHTSPLSNWIIEAANIIFERNQPQWTWAVLSCLLGASPVDQWTKNTLSTLRREYERFDGLTLIQESMVQVIGALEPPDDMAEAITDLCTKVLVLDTVPGAMAVDSRTGPGKLFTRTTQLLGIEGVLLRSPDGAPPLSVLRGEQDDTPTIAVRTDLLSAPTGELAYVFTFGMLLSRPECLPIASIPSTLLPFFAAAVQAAVRDSIETLDDPSVQHFASNVAKTLTDDELILWETYLQDPARVQRCVDQLYEQANRAAMRVASVAAGDSRTASRAICRLMPDNRRPPGVGNLEMFDAFFDSLPNAGALFGWFASEAFGDILITAK